MNFLLFWRVPLSCWEILSLRKMSFFALLKFTAVLLEDQLNFFALLEGTTVLLEDFVSKRDPNWIL